MRHNNLHVSARLAYLMHAGIPHASMPHVGIIRPTIHGSLKDQSSGIQQQDRKCQCNTLAQQYLQKGHKPEMQRDCVVHHLQSMCRWARSQACRLYTRIADNPAAQPSSTETAEKHNWHKATVGTAYVRAHTQSASCDWCMSSRSAAFVQHRHKGAANGRGTHAV